MSTITRYGFENGEGVAQEWSTFDYIEATTHAQRYHYKVIAYEFEFSDSEVVADYTIGETTDERADHESRAASS